MTIDITALDALPQTEPIVLADLDGVGLRFCVDTCSYTCIVYTCWFTEPW